MKCCVKPREFSISHDDSGRISIHLAPTFHIKFHSFDWMDESCGEMHGKWTVWSVPRTSESEEILQSHSTFFCTVMKFHKIPNILFDDELFSKIYDVDSTHPTALPRQKLFFIIYECTQRRIICSWFEDVERAAAKEQSEMIPAQGRTWQGEEEERINQQTKWKVIYEISLFNRRQPLKWQKKLHS